MQTRKAIIGLCWVAFSFTLPAPDIIAVLGMAPAFETCSKVSALADEWLGMIMVGWQLPWG